MFLWPSPVGEPMWTNGAADLRRLLGVEFGVRPSSSSFGPDDRYAGFGTEGKVPAMFAGAVLQPLPYLFVSGGAMFSTYRRSVLTTERYEPRVTPYIGLTVDANVVGWIRELIGASGMEIPATAPPK